jgi:hypothetical protein
MTETLDAHAIPWVARFEGLLLEMLPHLRRAAPDLHEDELIQLGSRLAERRLGGVVDLGSDVR